MDYIIKIKSFINLVIICCALVFACTGCDENKNNDKTITDLVEHFKKCGIQIEDIGGVIWQAIHAEDGVKIKIAGKGIGVYKFNLEKKKQLEKIEKIDSKGYVYIIGNKYPAKINGSFIMIGFQNNPKKKEIIEAFDSF